MLVSPSTWPTKCRPGPARGKLYEQIVTARAIMKLTARQEEMVQAICRGLSRKEIAREMRIGESGVKRQLEKLFARFNQYSMRGLAVAYLQAKHRKPSEKRPDETTPKSLRRGNTLL